MAAGTDTPGVSRCTGRGDPGCLLDWHFACSGRTASGSILFLLIVEILNFAIETVLDRVDPERNDLSRIAKDLGSAAVLLALLFPAAVWGAVVLSKLGLIAL